MTNAEKFSEIFDFDPIELLEEDFDRQWFNRPYSETSIRSEHIGYSPDQKYDKKPDVAAMIDDILLKLKEARSARRAC